MSGESGVNSNLQAVRTMLRNISPVKAKKLLEQCGLPDDEYVIILEHDIKQKSLVAVGDFLGMSYPTAKRKHKKALNKIYDTIMEL